ncbi:MAG: hypothetical protein KGJ78_16970 [Alphaproteobacteria bacterium]|nr:hypothetical protein [Alphaproteobacteria bacterium]
MKADPGAIAELPGVFGAVALPQLWLGCPVAFGTLVVAEECVPADIFMLDPVDVLMLVPALGADIAAPMLAPPVVWPASAPAAVKIVKTPAAIPILKLSICLSCPGVALMRLSCVVGTIGDLQRSRCVLAVILANRRFSLTCPVRRH